MHNREAKIANLIGEYLQIKKKIQNEKGRVRVQSRKRILFMRG
jgi:hypothetical protein